MAIDDPRKRQPGDQSEDTHRVGHEDRGEVADERANREEAGRGELAPTGDQDIDTAGTDADVEDERPLERHTQATMPPGQGRDPKRNTL